MAEDKGYFRPLDAPTVAKGIVAARAAARDRAADEWRPVVPVPDDAPRPPESHSKNGKPSRVWTYRDLSGRLLGYVWRFDRADGGKEFAPLTWNERGDGDGRAWRFKSWSTPRPLYGLDRLARMPDAPVLVVEGEKAADAAAELLEDWVVVTSPNGSKSATKAQWSDLAGRSVTIWPDADDAGAAYAAEVTRQMHAMAIEPRLVAPPADVPKGWDAADAHAQGWERGRFVELLAAAKPVPVAVRTEDGQETEEPEAMGGGDRRSRGGRRPPQRDGVVALLDGIELWHTPAREPYATVNVEGVWENWAVNGDDFRCFLEWRYLSENGGPPSRNAIDEALSAIAARARFEGPEYEPMRRVGCVGDRIYVDLVDEGRRAVEIDKDGWRIIQRAPVRFIRSNAMRALPEPANDGDSGLARLRALINVADSDDDADFKMLVAFLLGAINPRGAYPILVVNGEHGAAKSTATKIIQRLLDPSAIGGRSLPREERDLFVATRHSYAMFFDNVSAMPKEMSDCLAKISTGAGMALRKLHSNDEEEFFYARRPIALNGIPDFVTRADLLDRTLIVTLQAIPETDRKTEDAVWAEFDAAAPYILGHLYDAVSAALRHRDRIVLPSLTRMADFEVWITAAEPALGWEPGSFGVAYRAARSGAFAVSAEDDPVAAAIVAMFAKRGISQWEGTATELLSVLNEVATDAARKSRAWPQAVNGLAAQVRRVAPALRPQGVEIRFSKDTSSKRTRLVSIRLAAGGPADTPAPDGLRGP